MGHAAQNWESNWIFSKFWLLIYIYIYIYIEREREREREREGEREVDRLFKSIEVD